MHTIIEYFTSNFIANPLAFSISIATLILEIAIYQFKEMKTLVIGQCVVNLLAFLTFAFGDGLSGAAVCGMATVQTFLIYWLYQRNGKEIPLWFALTFVAVYLACSAVTYKGAADILPAAAAVLFALSVVQSKSWKYRIIMLVNSLLWIPYDIIVAAPIPMLVTHGIAVASVVVGMIRLDIKKWFK